MKSKLLPSKFKFAGYGLMLITSALIIADHSGLLINYYKSLYPQNISADGSFLLPASFVKTSFYLNQILPLTFIIALFFVVFSAEKIEDEWIQTKRLVSYKVAFFCIPVLTLISLRFNNLTFLLLANLIIVWVIQILTFMYLVKIQPRFINTDR